MLYRFKGYAYISLEVTKSLAMSYQVLASTSVFLYSIVIPIDLNYHSNKDNEVYKAYHKIHFISTISLISCPNASYLLLLVLNNKQKLYIMRCINVNQIVCIYCNLHSFNWDIHNDMNTDSASVLNKIVNQVFVSFICKLYLCTIMVNIW